jgi:nucleotide-binding universal stress UspA family protein
MNPSSLMVHLTAGKSNDAVLRFAADLATRVKVTRVIGISGCQPLQIYSSPDAYIPQDLVTWDLELIEKELKAAEKSFRLAFEGRVTDCQWRSTVVSYGTIADYVAEQMRAADMLVVAAEEAAPLFERHRVNLADLAIRAGKPVLVVGRGIDRLDVKSVVVGWKDTREARRAAEDALPLLKLAERVTVVRVAAKDDLDHARAGTEDVAAWLSGHGIAATARAVAATGDDSIELETIAKELDAGLLVGGAYGHSRLREWVLGGVTRDLLLRPARCSMVSH